MAKLLPFCVARRTRAQNGKINRVSYSEYFMEKFSDDSEDGEDTEDEGSQKDESYNYAEKSESVSVLGGSSEDNEVFVKKKKLGIDILVSVSNEGGDSEGVNSSSRSDIVSQRTRSRFNSVADPKMKKMGTVRNPVCLEVDELQSEEDEMEDDSVGMDLDRGKGKWVCNINKGGSGMNTKVSNGVRDGNRTKMQDTDISKDLVERKRMWVDSDTEDGGRMGTQVSNMMESGSREGSNGIKLNVDAREKNETDGVPASTSKKRKRVRPPNANELFKILANNIFNEEGTTLEDLFKRESPVEDNSAACPENLLPLVFSFGDDDAKPVDKSEHEKELDDLWADFDFTTEANNIGVYHDDEDHIQETNVTEVESDPSALCMKGKHHYVLDEEIGIRCKFCSFVKLDIKHIFPSWASSQFGERLTRSNTVKNKEVPLFFNDLFSEGKDGSCQGSHGYSTGTVWDLTPGLQGSMFLHQREAFEFMWRNLGGSISLDDLKSGVGSDDTGGCVISHAPGTGKTRLAIMFIQSYMKLFPECRPVIIAHRGLLETWKNEFKKWKVSLAIHDLNAEKYSGQEDVMALELVRKANKQDTTLMRLVKMYSWYKGESVILVSYTLFSTTYSDNDMRGSMLKKILLEKPGLIIFDEGHTPRNERSRIWEALEQIKTSKRIILSGTPFQNNFTELYNTLCLVRPKFAEKISFGTSKLKRPELFATTEEKVLEKRNKAKTNWDHLVQRVIDSKELKSGIKNVKSVIRHFVHVHSGKILDTLPGLRKCTIVLNPLPYQKSILDIIQQSKDGSFVNKDYRKTLISIHPSLAMHCLYENEKPLMDTPLLAKVRLNPSEGVKTKFVIELIRLCEALKEKVLVFCQFIEPLDIIRDQLFKLFDWTEGKEVLKMHGKLTSKTRQSLIDTFNDLSSEARVLLASTKACSEGISLVGASRVVLIDVLWNPSTEHQAISRAYRIGQHKFVYVYQLVTLGSGESDKCCVQATKDKMSKLVFSPEIDLNNIEESSSLAEEEYTSKMVAKDRILTEMTEHDNLRDIFKKISYLPKESKNVSLFTEEDINDVNNGHVDATAADVDTAPHF
ncbi:uncharacterized protein A4U43_C04F26560 [Asparagus officinalis]|uniref:Uncharacterized protein n=2 Tax=Asparagus officinalis TaxID=4686 RepID=A0A5P1F4K0_ASPOF|nr:uncharacterized protein A4U43_C04F26560 [Asparagus officinalis]